MFIIDCPRHQSRVLLGTRSIESLVNTPDGVDVHWHCHCGARGTLHTGRRRTESAVPVEVPAEREGALAS